MSNRTKHICVVLVAQASCLAVGLWMQYQFVRSSASNAAIQHAWSQLEATAIHVADKVMVDDLANLRAQSEQNELFTLRIKAASAANAHVMILDKQWRTMLHFEEADTKQPYYSVGDKINWSPVLDIEDGQDGSMFGKLDMPDGAHLAVVRKWQGEGYVVAHRSQSDVKLTAATLLTSHFTITGLTLIWTIALLSFSAYMVLARFHDQVEKERSQASADDLKHRQKLIRTRDAVIFGLAKLADSRDPETGEHLERISVYATILASALRRHPKYQNIVIPGFIRLIGISSALHDIGKVGIEDSILLKPGELTQEQRERMQYHTTIGGECLREIEYRLGSSNFLQMAREIAFSHHEHWDGGGYPCGLKGEDIPLAARIVAIVDVYDALSSRRVYKAPYPHVKCVEIIQQGAGKIFDSDLVDIWVSIAPRFEEIAVQYTTDTKRTLQMDLLPGGAQAGDYTVDDVETAEKVLMKMEKKT